MEHGTNLNIKVLDEPTAVSIILKIFDLQTASASDLRYIAGGYDRMKNLLKRMETIGIVTIQIEEKPRLTYVYELTSKGKKVAKKLHEIEEILASE
ncbi:MAG: hypothetical protein SA339_11910 [Methanomassiliicoccus sp.]|nr:hypothetical protein [Methanomassiliicoccus sp.]